VAASAAPRVHRDDTGHGRAVEHERREGHEHDARNQASDMCPRPVQRWPLAERYAVVPIVQAASRLKVKVRSPAPIRVCTFPLGQGQPRLEAGCNRLWLPLSLGNEAPRTPGPRCSRWEEPSPQAAPIRVLVTQTSARKTE
jgi:hypothetical protein